jgi:hypothetical protein
VPSDADLNAGFDALIKTVHAIINQMVPQFVPGFMQGQATQDINNYLATRAGRELVLGGVRDVIVAVDAERSHTFDIPSKT